MRACRIKCGCQDKFNLIRSSAWGFEGQIYLRVPDCDVDCCGDRSLTDGPCSEVGISQLWLVQWADGLDKETKGV